MGLSIIAEALARVEHKLDALLKFTGAPIMPMHFLGNSCPACMMPVDYTVDITHGVVVRRCACKTGKVPAAIPLMPVDPGALNGNPAEHPQPVAAGSDESSHRPGRKAR